MKFFGGGFRRFFVWEDDVFLGGRKGFFRFWGALEVEILGFWVQGPSHRLHMTLPLCVLGGLRGGGG